MASGIVDGYCEWLHKLIHPEINPIITDHAIIKLSILEGRLRDKHEIRRIMTQWRAEKDEAKDASETDYCLYQLDAYEMLLNCLP